MFKAANNFAVNGGKYVFVFLSRTRNATVVGLRFVYQQSRQTSVLPRVYFCATSENLNEDDVLGKITAAKTVSDALKIS